MSEKEKTEEQIKQAEQAEVAAAEAEAGDAALDELQQQLEEAEAKASENLDGWQRAQAEFANYKKRMARDQEQMHQDLRGRIIKPYLEVVDDLERALQNRPEGEEGAQWAEGVELVYRKLMTYLEAEGVAQMEMQGHFDPNFHEAIAQEESEEHESGEILEVLQPGYMLGERVLRPAVVKVAQ